MEEELKEPTGCNICCLNFTNKKRIRFECIECEFYFCSECLKNDYKVKKETKEELVCFNCKFPFSQKFLKEVFSKTFFQKEILTHLSEAEFEKEMRDLPKAQSLATYDNSILNWKKLLEEQKVKKEETKKTINLLNFTRPRPPEFVEDLIELKKKCPMEECRGFLDKHRSCESCNKMSCELCEEEFLEGHICDSDLLLTLEEKKRDSKPCPKCEIPISKINGCNQMWCPMCNTVFDYISGKIDNGYIHNPEYLAHMRGGGNFIERAEGDVRLCDDLNLYSVWLFSSSNYFFRHFGLENKFISFARNQDFKEKYGNEVLEKLYNIKVLITDIKTFMNKNKTSKDIKYKKRQLQADFINKKITEAKWKYQLKSFLKLEESNNELKEICTCFMRSLNDVLSNCIEMTINMEDKNLTKFNIELNDNTLEIANIHNKVIFENRNEVGFKSPKFYPFYMKA